MVMTKVVLLKNSTTEVPGPTGIARRKPSCDKICKESPRVLNKRDFLGMKFPEKWFPERWTVYPS